MAIESYLTLRQREASLTDSARDEMRAHAYTLQMALEEDIRTGRNLDIQKLIDRLGKNPGIYGVLLFNDTGEVTMVSDSIKAQDIRDVEEAKKVIAGGNPIEHIRLLNGENVFSIMLPLRSENRIIGALEIAQQISFVKAFIDRERRQKVVTTLLLCATIFLAVLIVTHFNLTQPIGELLRGAVALGRGDLNYRVTVSGSGSEIAGLAQEFNRMANHLAEQRASAAHEAEERLALERQLRHSERLASVGRLAAGVAHEMGAPLQVIDGRSKQLLNQPDAPLEMRQRNLTIIRTQAERIARIVRQLLTLARPYNLQLQEVNLRQLLADTVEMIETNAARANIRVELKVEEDVAALGDPDLLHQVLSNICFNAIQEMPKGGHLLIECAENSCPKHGGDFTIVRISDTGPGIAPEHIPHIFDPFYSTKEVGSGTGLGLAVSSRIVEEHGGWIEAANRPGGGACFSVYLPRTSSNKGQSAATSNGGEVTG
jgi:signal transduction histidine kinase